MMFLAFIGIYIAGAISGAAAVLIYAAITMGRDVQDNFKNDNQP
ncbi:MAG TPA: hypothetical protein VFB72_16150 [Verrucomicrobiae bacterium]|nr:hypothetical protein [Verrucomicrobiae bacterium]